MIYWGLVILLFLHAFTVAQTFIIGWGYSVTGFSAIQKIFGKDFDHTPWNIERGVVVIGMWLSCFIGGLTGDHIKAIWISTINTASWWACFPLLQQISHNATLNKFKVLGYAVNIKSSPNGTAKTETTPWMKIIFFTIGMLLPITYCLL